MRNVSSLSQNDRDILFAMELAAETSLETFARKLKRTARSVQHSVDNIRSRGIIRGKKVAVNRSRIGLQDFQLYLALDTPTRRNHDEVMKSLLADPRVTWLAELGGAYHIGLGVTVPDMHQLQLTLDTISANTLCAFRRQQLLLRTRLVSFARAYLGTVRGKRGMIDYGTVQPAIPLDETDQRLLSTLGKGDWWSFREVAQSLGTTASTVTRRIQRLKDDGVIRGFYFAWDPTQFGIQSFILLISTGGTRRISSELLAYAAAHPHITTYVECFGGWDYQLTLELTDARAAYAITCEIERQWSSTVMTTELLPFFGVRKTYRFMATS